MHKNTLLFNNARVLHNKAWLLKNKAGLLKNKARVLIRLAYAFRKKRILRFYPHILPSPPSKADVQKV